MQEDTLSKMMEWVTNLQDINDEMYQTDPEDWMGYDDSTEGLEISNDF